MTTVLSNGFRRGRLRLTVVGLTATTFVLGGCTLPFSSGRQSSHSEQPLSDGQSVAQVVDPAKQIVKMAKLHDVSGKFRWETCNDHRGKPYRGRLDMTFIVPPGADHNAYFRQIAHTMESNGWSAGPLPGLRASGTAIHQENVMATIGISPYVHADGAVQLLGQCRNMNDHSRDGAFSVEDQLLAG